MQPGPSFASTASFLFQSSPDPEVGCNDLFRTIPGVRARVSILTRPGGRVQPNGMVDMATRYTQFQSSPDPEVGCNHRCWVTW